MNNMFEVKVISKIDKRKCRFCSERLKPLIGEVCHMSLENNIKGKEFTVSLICAKNKRKNNALDKKI